jgi:PAS domain S-box-containing protein
MFCFPGRSLLAHSAAEQLGYLAKVMEKSAQPFVSVDADGSIIICNRQFANLTGFDQEELSCKKWERDFVPAQSISKSDINWGDIRATGQPRRYETEYNCKNGSTLSVEVTLHKVEEQPDERPCYFALVTDITARKNTENKLLQANRDLEIMKTELLAATQQMMASEEELRYQLEELKISRQALFDSESKYRNILDSIEDGYYEVDVHGNISFVNRYIIQFTGLSLDELLGMNYKRAFDRRNAKKLRSAFHRVYLSGQPVRDLVWFVVTRKDKQKCMWKAPYCP